MRCNPSRGLGFLAADIRPGDLPNRTASFQDKGLAVLKLMCRSDSCVVLEGAKILRDFGLQHGRENCREFLWHELSCSLQPDDYLELQLLGMVTLPGVQAEGARCLERVELLMHAICSTPKEKHSDLQ